jgi:hypothetical protein
VGWPHGDIRAKAWPRRQAHGKSDCRPRDEARRIAANIAKLPGLLGRKDYFWVAYRPRLLAKLRSGRTSFSMLILSSSNARHFL